MEKLEQAAQIISQVSELANNPVVSQVAELKSEVEEAMKDGKEHKLKDMAHKLIDILAKVIPIIKSLIFKRQRTEEVTTRGFSTLSNRSAIMLSILVKLLSVYSAATDVFSTRSIVDEVSIVEDAMKDHVFTRDLDDSCISLEEAAEYIADVLNADSTEDIYEVLLELKSGLDSEELAFSDEE